MVLRAEFKTKLRLYVELKIYDKNRRKITGPQCVKINVASVWAEHTESNPCCLSSAVCSILCSHKVGSTVFSRSTVFQGSGENNP
jgi:hypothetical protein